MEVFVFADLRVGQIEMLKLPTIKVCVKNILNSDDASGFYHFGHTVYASYDLTLCINTHVYN